MKMASPAKFYAVADEHGYFAPPPSSEHSLDQRTPPLAYRYPNTSHPAAFYCGDPSCSNAAECPSSFSPSAPQKRVDFRHHGFQSSGGKYHDGNNHMSPLAYRGYGRGGDESRKVSGDSHRRFVYPMSPVQSRQDIEETASPSPVPSSEPTPVDQSAKVSDDDLNDKDILSGRGGGTNTHPGNKNFRQLVESYRSEYVLSKKAAKREIARRIVNTIRQDGGRFLKREGVTWREIGDQKAREKTSQALREGLAAKMRQAYRDSAVRSHMPILSTPPQYSPHSVSGQVHERGAEVYLETEPYDLFQSTSPLKKRRLHYEREQIIHI